MDWLDTAWRASEKAKPCQADYKEADLVRGWPPTGWIGLRLQSWLRVRVSFFNFSVQYLYLNGWYCHQLLEMLVLPFCSIVFGAQMELHLSVPHWCLGGQLSCWVTLPGSSCSHLKANPDCCACSNDDLKIETSSFRIPSSHALLFWHISFRFA